MKKRERKILKTLFFLILFIFGVTRIEAFVSTLRSDRVSEEGQLNQNSSGNLDNEISSPDTSPPATSASPGVPEETQTPESGETENPLETETPSPDGQTDDASGMQTEQPSGTLGENQTENPSETPTGEPEETGQPTETASNSSIENVVSPYYSADEYGSPYIDGVLSNKKLSWNYSPNDSNLPPTAQKEFDIRQFDAYYLGDIYSKVLYLTFDEGYENGYTSVILDVLKEKGVKVTFFVTKTYIQANLELIMRMINEGHIVGNHSVSHKSSPTLSDEEFLYELEETARYYKEKTGFDMKKYFRPPMGEYSARTLSLTQGIGYKTIFWSFAYRDWLVDAQPGKEVAFNSIVSRMHNGCILLLHAVSQSNAEALPDFIDHMRAQGYQFKSLDDL